MGLQDQMLLSMQQKVDNLFEQLNTAGGQQGTSAKTNVESPLNETFGSGCNKFLDCDCWICDQHLEQFKVRIQFMAVANKLSSLVT